MKHGGLENLKCIVVVTLCVFFLLVSSNCAKADWSVGWSTDSDWKTGATYENARVQNGSVNIGIYPGDPNFSGTNEWTFTTNEIIEVNDLAAGYSGGRARFFSGDDSPTSSETGVAEAYAENVFYLDSTGIEDATLTFYWKGYSLNFNEAGGYTELKIRLENPAGGWINIDGSGNLWTKRFDTPSNGGEDTQTVSLSSSNLQQTGYYTMRIYVYWYFQLGGWGADDDFTWYVDDISFGFTRATHTTSWKDVGIPSAWKTLNASFSIGSGQSITAQVQVSDDGTTVKGTKSVSLLNGTNSYSISSLPNARYIRIVSSFTTDSEANTPRLDSYTVTADPAPTLSLGDVTPDNGPLYTTFTYAVTYTDSDGDEPSYVKVYIDGTGYDMTKATGTYTSGATYQFLTATLSAGSYSYYFYASDGTSTVRLPTSGSYPGPIVGLTPTTLSVSPSSFTLGSGQNRTLTATLTSGESPVAGKTITWAKTAGSLSVTSSTTNSSGQASVTYTAPSVSASTEVTISASFAGDSQYGSSDNSSSATVSPTSTFEITITFSKPGGSVLTNTTIYYGTSKGAETSYLGTTDSYGRITSTDSALAGQTIYYKSSDGRYSGSTYVSSSGGTASVSLTEVAAFPWGSVVMLLIVGVSLATVLALALKKRPATHPKTLKHKLETKPGSEPAPVKPAGRFCAHCKLKLPADADFCPECGRKIKG